MSDSTARLSAMRVMRIAMLAFLFVIGGVKTTEAQYIEQVHLKNGSIIRGIITEQVPGVNMKIQTADGSIFVYNYDEIEKISKDFNATQPNSRSFYKQSNPLYKDAKTPRYEGGVAFALTVFPLGVGFNTTHGCLISPYFYIGAGLGFSGIFSTYSYGLSLPVFGDARIYFMKGALKPYANIRAGYDVLLNGVYVGPSFGLRYKFFDFNIGYLLQQEKYKYEYWSWNYYYSDYYSDYYSGTGKLSYHMLSINIGVRF